MFFLSNPVPFNGQDYKKTKGTGTSDQLLFTFQSKFRKLLYFFIILSFLKKIRKSKRLKHTGSFHINSTNDLNHVTKFDETWLTALFLRSERLFKRYHCLKFFHFCILLVFISLKLCQKLKIKTLITLKPFKVLSWNFNWVFHIWPWSK